MKREIVLTEDGSSSLYVEEIQEHFHSHFGAIQEAQHIFIQNGFCEELKSEPDQISILEIGFGTGLNCFLTILESIKDKSQVYYEGIEKFPLSEAEYKQLNYASVHDPHQQYLFDKLHELPWEVPVTILPNFKLCKRECSFETTIFDANRFDVVYFDPFSPDKQPEMWEFSVIKKVYDSMKNSAILMTYCTKGVVKRTFKEVGFKIEKLPGPIGKREILRATKV
jgi:tRNA U34 5-methylaminomethyl-2-thiouridine-forming methyltransferase MnmC